jgi:hypothetical protein
VKRGLILFKGSSARMEERASTEGKRQVDRKRTSLARAARDRDGRAVPIGDPLGQGEAQTSAVGMARPRWVDTVKALEKARERVGRDADAGVAYIEPGGAVLTRHAQRDAAACGRELDGVVEEVQQESLEPACITPDDDFVRRLARQLDAPGLSHRLELFDHRRAERGEIYRLMRKRDFARLGRAKVRSWLMSRASLSSSSSWLASPRRYSSSERA